jgi:perosamine synthetase
MIPVNEPLLDGNELKYLAECINTGWISSAGRFIEEFEQGWARYVGMEHGVSVANGTVALELAMAALNLPPQSEVILPSFTIISCAQAIIRAGCVPVAVDCEPDTWCMDMDQAAKAVTSKTKAIMPVHIYGHPVDMDPLRDLAQRHGLVIVEDAAEAHGAKYKGARCGGLGHVSCFSFYANKIVTTGEGGMVLTSDRDLAQRLRYMRNLCFQGKTRFWHEDLGFNYRLTNLQAAVGLAQMERIEKFLAGKRAMAKAYNEGLKDLPLHLPAQKPWAENVYWMYGMVLDDAVAFEAKELAERLAEQGVQTRPFFRGLHEQPVLGRMGFLNNLKLPVTERISRRGLYLPSGQALTEEQINKVIGAVRRALKAV